MLVSGAAVVLAARLEQHAQPGQILIDEDAVQMLRQVARARPVAPLAVKGVDAPLLAWEVLEVYPPQGREVRTTPFVGREDDLNLLLGYPRRMRRGGRGCLITTLGEAGVGKSRLAQEFRARAGEVQVLRGRAISYGSGVPFWALGDVIRDECGIFFGDPLPVCPRNATRTGLSVNDL